MFLYDCMTRKDRVFQARICRFHLPKQAEHRILNNRQFVQRLFCKDFFHVEEFEFLQGKLLHCFLHRLSACTNGIIRQNPKYLLYNTDGLLRQELFLQDRRELYNLHLEQATL